MLLIEGPDMVGKTTFAQAVAKKLTEMGAPASYMKFGMESRGRMTAEYLMPRINTWQVTDRMHWSESIYAVATGHKPSLPEADMRAVDRYVTAKRGMLVMIVASVESYPVIASKLHSRGEDFSIETCASVNVLYRDSVRRKELLSSSGAMVKVAEPDVIFEVQADHEGDIWFAPDSMVDDVAREYARRQTA